MFHIEMVKYHTIEDNKQEPTGWIGWFGEIPVCCCLTGSAWLCLDVSPNHVPEAVRHWVVSQVALICIMWHNQHVPVVSPNLGLLRHISLTWLHVLKQFWFLYYRSFCLLCSWLEPVGCPDFENVYMLLS